jgi:ABC-type sugar transport system substrate-binding protein
MKKRSKTIGTMLACLTVFCLVFGLSACGGNETPSNESTSGAADAATEVDVVEVNFDDLMGDGIGKDYGLGPCGFDLDGLVDQIGRDKVANLRIGVNVNNATSSWTKQWGEEWEALQKEYGFQATILYSNDDSVNEADNVATFLNTQVDGIAISPIGPTTAAPVAQAYGKIPIVACIPIDGGQVDVTVNVDQEAKGRMIADHVAAEANGAEVNVLAMDISLDMPNLHARVTGFQKQCEEKYPNIKIIEEVREINPDAFLNLAKSAFTAHPEINTVLTTYSEPLKSAYQAATQIGRNDIKLYGVDADEATLELLDQEKIQGMHVQFANVQADTCFFYLLRLIAGDKTVPKDVWEAENYAMHYATPEDAYKMLNMWYPDRYPISGN